MTYARMFDPWLRVVLVFVLSFAASCDEPQSGDRVSVGSGCGSSDVVTDDDDQADDDTMDDDDAADDDTVADDDVADDDTGVPDDDTSDDDTTEVDCESIPDGPFQFTVKMGPKATEDLAFDDEGNLIGADSGNLFKSPYTGTPTPFVANAGGFIAGLRALPDGDIVYSDTSTNTIYRASSDGSHWAVLSGMNYGNGIEIGLDGFVYVAEQTGGRVRRIDPDTGDFTILAEGLDAPNGISFSPDYRTLYIGSFGWGKIWSLEVDEDGNPGELVLLVDNLAGGMLDGMAVDACGNIYVCEYIAALVWRISPDGQNRVPIVNLSSETSWIPNMQWGSGVGGWESDVLYVNDISANKLYEVPVGVPDKPRLYP